MLWLKQGIRGRSTRVVIVIPPAKIQVSSLNSVSHRGEILLPLSPGEHSMPREHLEEDAAQSPDISLRTISTVQQLWSLVLGRSPRLQRVYIEA